MDRFDLLRTFVTAAEKGTFSVAAKALGVSSQAVEERMRQLEQQFGVRLFNRSTLAVALTPPALHYFDRVKALLDEYESIRCGLRSLTEKPGGRLVVAAPRTFAERCLMPHITEFLELYDEIGLDLRLSDQRTELLTEKIDVALRIGPVSQGFLISKRIASLETVICASPAYITQRGIPRSPEELSDHDCIIDTNFRQPLNWEFIVGCEVFKVPVSGSVEVNSSEMACQLATAGLGIAYVPYFSVREQLTSGQLVQLLTGFRTVRLDLTVLYQDNERLPTVNHHFIDFISKKMASLSA